MYFLELMVTDGCVAVLLTIFTLHVFVIFQRELWILTSVLLFCLVLLPIMLYLSVFYVHLSILYKAGPHDDMMTSSFQASLEVC